MARVTVEDCVQKVPNRFELVMMAGQRARDISAGAPLTVERDNDKNPVVALREIAEGTIDLEALREALIKGHQKVQELDEPEDEIIELMAGEEEWLRRGVQGPAALGDVVSDDAEVAGAEAAAEEDEREEVEPGIDDFEGDLDGEPVADDEVPDQPEH